MALKVRTTSPLPPRTTGRWTINRERQILICSPKSTKTTNRDAVWLLLLYLILCFICCIPVNVYCKDFLPRPTRLSYAGIIGKGTTTGNCTMCFPMPLQRLDTNSPGAKKTFSLFHVLFFFIFSTVGKGCYLHYFDPLVSCQLQCTFTYFEKLNTVKWILTQKKKREDKRSLHNGKAQKRNILVILYNCLCKTPLNHYAILLRQAKQE